MIKFIIKQYLPLLMLLASVDAHATECVDYITGTRGLYTKLIGSGSAYKWWEKANGAGYVTDTTPQVGSVLVFKPWDNPDPAKFDNLHGHVALVSEVNVDGNPLKIRIDHANWSLTGKVDGNIVTGALVESADSSWSRIKMAYGDKNNLGSSFYETYGFVKPVSAETKKDHWGFIAYKSSGSYNRAKGEIVSIKDKSVTLTDRGSVFLVLAHAKEGEANLVPVSFEACGDKVLPKENNGRVEFISANIYNKEKTRKFHTAIGIIRKDFSGLCQWKMVLKNNEIYTGTITIPQRP